MTRRLLITTVLLATFVLGIIVLWQDYQKPTSAEQAVFASVTAHIARHGVDQVLADQLLSYAETQPTYVAEWHNERLGDARIVACSFPGAVGISVLAFQDQFARQHVSQGPMTAPDGKAYRVYIAR